MTEATEGGLGSGRKGHQEWMKEITELKTNKHKMDTEDMTDKKFIDEFAVENRMCNDCMDSALESLIGEESLATATEGKTYTCDFCGKVGTDFVEMGEEPCPSDAALGGNHQIPIFGDMQTESKASEFNRKYAQKVADYFGMDLQTVIDAGNLDEMIHEYEQDVDFAERESSFYGESKATEKMWECGNCDGTGKDEFGYCYNCKGTGQLSEEDMERQYQSDQKWKKMASQDDDYIDGSDVPRSGDYESKAKEIFSNYTQDTYDNMDLQQLRDHRARLADGIADPEYYYRNGLTKEEIQADQNQINMIDNSLASMEAKAKEDALNPDAKLDTFSTPFLEEEDRFRNDMDRQKPDMESKASEDDPDFREPDFTGVGKDDFGNPEKQQHSQYTIDGFDFAEQELNKDRGDIEFDSLERKAKESGEGSVDNFFEDVSPNLLVGDDDDVRRCLECGAQFDMKADALGKQELLDHLYIAHGIEATEAKPTMWYDKPDKKDDDEEEEEVGVFSLGNDGESKAKEMSLGSDGYDWGDSPAEWYDRQPVSVKQQILQEMGADMILEEETRNFVDLWGDTNVQNNITNSWDSLKKKYGESKASEIQPEDLETWGESIGKEYVPPSPEQMKAYFEKKKKEEDGEADGKSEIITNIAKDAGIPVIKYDSKDGSGVIDDAIKIGNSKEYVVWNGEEYKATEDRVPQVGNCPDCGHDIGQHSSASTGDTICYGGKGGLLGDDKFGCPCGRTFPYVEESKATEGKTYTCSYCGKVGTDFSDMAKEICPENPPIGQNGHQIPIMGDRLGEAKANEEHINQVCPKCGSLEVVFDAVQRMNICNNCGNRFEYTTGEAKATEDDFNNSEFSSDEFPDRTCKNCNGAGVVDHSWKLDAYGLPLRYTCPECGGNGEDSSVSGNIY